MAREIKVVREADECSGVVYLFFVNFDRRSSRQSGWSSCG